MRHRQRPIPYRQRRSMCEQLELRRCLASVGWDGPGQGGAELTYYIANPPSQLAGVDVQGAIERALDVWEEVIDIKFTPTSQPGLRDSLDFSFRRLDGPGGTLAQAYFPDDVNPARIAGDVEFDISETWEVGNARGRNAFDLVQVAVHEIGHALGLDHAEHGNSVMAATVSPNVAFNRLDADDVDAALALYAPAVAGNVPPSFEDPTPEMEIVLSPAPTLPGLQPTDDAANDPTDTGGSSDSDPFVPTSIPNPRFWGFRWDSPDRANSWTTIFRWGGFGANWSVNTRWGNTQFELVPAIRPWNSWSSWSVVGRWVT